MRKQIFFVITHASIYHKVFPLIEERKKYGEIIIVTINDDLEKFLREYTDFKVIRLHVNPNLITQKTKHKLIWNVIKSKIEYKKIFGNIQDADVFFFSHAYAIVTFSYIKKLAKNNIVHQYCSNSNLKLPFVNGLLPLIMKSISKIFLNVDVKIRSDEGQLICVLADDFYKNMSRKSKKKFDTSISNTYLKEVKQLKNKNILLLSSNITDKCSFVSNDEATRVTDILMDSLNDRRNDCIIKVHPGDNNKVYGKMKELTDFVPSYIPAEFLTHHNWDFVIGVISTAMITFAKKSKIVISIIKMLEWDDTIKRDYWLDIYGKLPVIMPENEKELNKILCEHSQT